MLYCSENPQMVTSLVIRKQWCRKKQHVSIKYMDNLIVDMTFISMGNNVIFLCYWMIILTALMILGNNTKYIWLRKSTNSKWQNQVLF